MVKPHVFYLNNGDAHGFDLGTHAKVKSKLKNVRFTNDLHAASRVLLPRSAIRPSERVRRVFPNPKLWHWEHEILSQAHQAGAYDWQIVVKGNQRNIRIPGALEPPSSVSPDVLKRIQDFETSLVSEADVNRASATLRNRRGKRPPKERKHSSDDRFQLPSTQWGPPYTLDPMEIAVSSGSGPEFFNGSMGSVSKDEPPPPSIEEEYKPLPLPTEVDIARAYTADEVVKMQQRLFEAWFLQVKPMFGVITDATDRLPEWRTQKTAPSAFGPFVLLVEEALDTILNMMELSAVWKIFLEKHNTGNAFASFGQVDIEPADDVDIFTKAVQRAYLSGSFSNTILLLTKLNAYMTSKVLFFKEQYDRMFESMTEAYQKSKGTLECDTKEDISQVCVQITGPGDEFGAKVMGQSMLYTVADLQKMICNRVQTIASREIPANGNQRGNVSMNKRATYNISETNEQRYMHDITDSLNFVLEHLGKEPVRLAGREDFCAALDNTLTMVLDIFKKDYLTVFSKQAPIQPLNSFWIWVCSRVPEVEAIIKDKMFPIAGSSQKSPPTAFEVYQQLRAPINKSADHVLYAIGVFLSCVSFQMMLFMKIATYDDISTFIHMDAERKSTIEKLTKDATVRPNQAYTMLQGIRAKKRSFERRIWRMFHEQTSMLTDVVNKVVEAGTGVWDTVRELGYYFR